LHGRFIDDFQGHEQKIILISTVLTHRDDNNESGSSSSSSSGGGIGGGGEGGSGGGGSGSGGNGFLGDEKRFCVAITRAKALTIVVGHPAVLIRDKCWGEMLRYCAGSGAYTGCECAELREEMLARGMDVGDSMGVADDGTEDYIERVLMFSSQQTTLGSGDAQRMYPTDLGDAYRDDLEWRVML
jgi:putative helicase MOV10L1